MSEKNRIRDMFASQARKGECALVCYVVAGYPDAKTSEAIIEMLVQGGADAIEIGIPFSDPIADGPAIEAASHASLEKGTRPANALAISARVRKKHPDLPLLIMTYSNILAHKGFDVFAIKAKEAGIDGFILPDMPIEEAEEYAKATNSQGLSTVFLASPNTAPIRLKRILDATSGFLYLVSVYGITGARSSFESYTAQATKDVKLATGARIPVAVGFGISRPEHVKFMKSAGADAVIVGSAIVNLISSTKGGRDKMLKKIKDYTRTMKAACKE